MPSASLPLAKDKRSFSFSSFRRASINTTFSGHGWTRMILAGAEVALLSWALTCALVIGGYWLQAQNQWLTETSWTDVLGFGTRFYGGAAFGPYPLGGAWATLPPAGLTLLIIGLSQLALRLRREVHIGALFAFPLGFSLLTTVLVLSISGSSSLWQVLLGSLLLGIICAAVRAFFMVRAHRKRLEDSLGLADVTEFSDPLLELLGSQDRNYYRGVRTGLRLLGVLLAVSLLSLGAALALNFGKVLDIGASLGAEGASRVFLVLLQLAYLPVYLFWALSWVAGTGFWIGEGVHFAPSAYAPGPLPAIPLIGAVPHITTGFTAALWPLFLVLGIYLGLRPRGSQVEQSWRGFAQQSAGAILVFLPTVAIWGWTSYGALGLGRMQFVGVQFLPAVLNICLQSLALFLLTRFMLLASTWTALAGAWQSARKKLHRERLVQPLEPEVTESSESDQESE